MISLSRRITFALLFVACSLSAQVDFRDLPFDSLLHRARAADQLVFVDAYTDWCGWCKVMDRETFSQSEVGDFLNSRFVSTKIDMERGFGVKLAMKHRVTSYPHYLIFDADGQLLARLSGYMEPEPFIAAIETALQPENTLPALSDPLDFDPPYPDFLVRAYTKGRDKTPPSAQEVEAYLDTRNDLTDAVSWAVISRFVRQGKYADTLVALRPELISKYGNDEVTDKLASFVFADVKRAIKDSSREALTEALAKADRTLGDAAPYHRMRYRLYYDQMTGDWTSFAQTAATLIAEMPDKAPATTQNGMAWALYENADDPQALTAAAEWMETLVAEQPRYAYLDTYAALLYKLGQKERALTAAQRALEAAETEEEDDSATRELIEKIRGL